MTCFSRHVAGAVACGLMTIAASSCTFKRPKYENPITKDTQQPDKVLFDKAMHDVERGRYEVARLTLNTLMNTYDTSEYMAKAKLLIADSWYRQGGVQGLTQAEADYKDFELFYPTMPEAAEAQRKICAIHFKEMDKPDRDPNQALHAETECRQLLTQYPNSKFVPETEQMLREIQEDLAEGEMRVGNFQHQRGDWAASSNRLGALVDQYPLYSRADEALWLEADSYSHMRTIGRPEQGAAYQKLVREYPLSPYAELAKKKLQAMELEVPQADPAAVARMKFEMENRTKPGVFDRATSFLRTTPDTYMAAKSGSPQMNNPKSTVPISVPAPAGAAGFNGDVTVAPATDAAAATATPNPQVAAQAPTFNQGTANASKGKKQNKKKQQQTAQQPAAPAQPDPTQPPASAPPQDSTPPAAPQ
jgi:outer membrane protein assembly factor BamD